MQNRNLKFKIFVSLFFFLFFFTFAQQPVLAGVCSGGKCVNPGRDPKPGETTCVQDFDCVIGKVTNPNPTSTLLGNDVTQGLIPFINTFLKIVIIIAGLWSLFNVVFAGIQFVNAGGDAKAVAAAWSKITMSFVGMIVIISSFLIAAIMGIIFFGNPGAILSPTISIP